MLLCVALGYAQGDGHASTLKPRGEGHNGIYRTAWIPVNTDSVVTKFNYFEVSGILMAGMQITVYKYVENRAKTMTYIYTTGDEFIEDPDTGRRFKIVSSSIGNEDNPTLLPSRFATVITETYQAVDRSVRRINISSGSAYYARNVELYSD